MKIVDANVILRFLLDDVEELSRKAAEILEIGQSYIPNEIVAEVVYVLEKVYKVDREDIKNSLGELLNSDGILTDNVDILITALELYSIRKLDFVDTLLFAYNKVEQYEIFTFDKKLKKLME